MKEGKLRIKTSIKGSIKINDSKSKLWIKKKTNPKKQLTIIYDFNLLIIIYIQKQVLKLMIYLIFMSGFIVKDLVVNYTIRSKAF